MLAEDDVSTVYSSEAGCYCVASPFANASTEGSQTTSLSGSRHTILAPGTLRHALPTHPALALSTCGCFLCLSLSFVNSLLMLGTAAFIWRLFTPFVLTVQQERCARGAAQAHCHACAERGDLAAGQPVWQCHGLPQSQQA